MATIHNVRFDTYALYHVANGPHRESPVSLIADCYDEGRYVGRLWFWPEGATVPANEFSGGQVHLHFRLARAGEVLATLRTEKPLFLLLNEATQWGYVGTAALEPVGEQEGAARA